MDIQKRIQESKIIAVLCLQFGDSGKGKIDDLLTHYWRPDVNARGTGGGNAGHTVSINNQEFIFHQLPAGIIHDKEGVITIIGNGMVIDIKELCKEISVLESAGFPYKNLMISKDAHIVMPWHIFKDKQKNQSQKNGGVGSTGRGIGPCYEDKIGRRGISANDLLDLTSLEKKMKKIKEYCPEYQINFEQIVQELEPYIQKIKPFIKDTITEMHSFVRKGKKILLEGAQGALLSIEHGTYPFVTSSDCTLNGTANGVGLSAQAVDLTIGLVKFPFMTRVGAGPFPTECGGQQSERYCAEETPEGKSLNVKEAELKNNNIPHTKHQTGKISYEHNDPKIIEMINSSNELVQGIGIRLAANEYGATTGRPRRVGWTDAVAARYAADIVGPKCVLALTKPDSLAGAKSFKLCFDYYNKGISTQNFDKDESFLRSVVPVFKTYEGYGEIGDIRKFEELPKSLRQAIKDFEAAVGREVGIVSVGPDRDQTIFCQSDTFPSSVAKPIQFLSKPLTL